MNAEGTRGPEREMAEGLARALGQAFAAGAGAPGLRAARDVAQILGLDALDRALAAFEPLAGRALPADFMALRDRLLRMAARAGDAGSDVEFRDGAAELDALVAEIRPHERTDDARATLSALAALEDVRLAEPAPQGLADVRLTLPVASALRAALDWLDPTPGFGRAVAVRVEGAVLEAALHAVEPAGLEAAGDLLGSVGGALVPANGGAWLVRVPCVGARATFLVVVQGGRTLALPWPSVVRVHMMPAAQVEARAAELGIPLTVPFAVAPRTARDLPVVTIALGAKRAWLVADRLIWRLAADSGDALDSASSGRVRTDDGTECELVDVARLLERLPGPSLALPPARRAAPVAHAPSAAAPATAPIAEPARVAEPAAVAEPSRVAPAPHRESSREAARASEPARRALSATDVLPLPAPAAPVLTAAAATPLAAVAVAPAPAARIEPAPAPRAPAARVESAPPARPAPAPHAQPAPPAPPVTPPAVAPRYAAPAPLPTRDEMMAGFAAAFERLRGEPPARPARPAPRALVAEDSLVARVFLSRLLEAEGYEVHGVDRAAAMWERLAEGEWAILCVDVELPDARGEALLAEAARRLAPHRDADLVALVRDEEDEAAAARAGVAQLFRKPFDQGTVARLAARRRLAPGSRA